MSQAVSQEKVGLSGIFAPLFGASVILGVASWMNVTELGRRYLEKYPPDWSGEGLLRTGACVASAALFAVALRRIGGPTRDLGHSARSDGLPFVAGLATIALMAFTIAVMLASPGSLIDYVAELHSVAVLQEVMLAGAVGLVAAALVGARGKAVPPVGPLKAKIVLAIMGLALFVLLMEETSYGQHYLGFVTPETFAANIQNETNLHNFYTYRFELAFYSIAIFAFVVLPFAWPARPPAFLTGLSFYVPPRSFAVLGLPVCAYLYNGWNILPFQAGFFLAICVAVLMARDLRREAPREAAAVAAFAALLALSQIVIFATGHLLVEHYETDEIRETHIALMCLAYAAWLAARVRALPRAKAAR